jgi:hypothetical protein
MKKYIFVHNQQDELSRKVLKQLPWFSLSEQFCVLDWYTDERERWKRSCRCHKGEPFYGVPPSAFPEIHTLQDGKWGRVSLAQDLSERLNPDRWDWQNDHYACIGGQWLDHVPSTIEAVHPELSELIKEVYDRHINLSVVGRLL